MPGTAGPPEKETAMPAARQAAVEQIGIAPLAVRRVAAGLAVLASLSTACGSGTHTAPAPTSFTSPGPLPAGRLTPVFADPETCPGPPRERSEIRPAAVPSGWETLWAEGAQGTALLDATVTADGTIWAAHADTTGRHVPWRWNGSRWTPAELPANLSEIQTVAAESKDRAWVFGKRGNDGYAASYEAGRWRVESIPGQGGWPSFSSSGPWVAEHELTRRWNGGAWQAGRLGFPVQALASFGTETWAVGASAAARWDGGGWQRIGMPSLGVPGDADVLWDDVAVLGNRHAWVFGRASWEEAGPTRDDNEPWIVDRSFGLRFAEGTWQCVWDLATWEAEPDGEDGMWLAAADDELWHLSGDGRWTRQRLPVPRGWSVSVHELALRPGTTEVYAVGSAGPKDPSARALNGVQVKGSAMMWRLSGAR
ncbi:hypothetical protein HTZ77_34655 [Nonomuraea sp. SMC257]|uniref:Uncharacterized protein n=1 Tax=Nonomuraea montanisoli TaxID=2741721 RepID=A0A7Y6IDZ1_9ACTN|nr:hypothetical protein [Nonomuraea montanisoli]NUW36510.1 hypothetical protein [Nonomuraea montanisoli]